MFPSIPIPSVSLPNRKPAHGVPASIAPAPRETFANIEGIMSPTPKQESRQRRRSQKRRRTEASSSSSSSSSGSTQPNQTRSDQSEFVSARPVPEMGVEDYMAAYERFLETSQQQNSSYLSRGSTQPNQTSLNRSASTSAMDEIEFEWMANDYDAYMDRYEQNRPRETPTYPPGLQIPPYRPRETPTYPPGLQIPPHRPRETPLYPPGFQIPLPQWTLVPLENESRSASLPPARSFRQEDWSLYGDDDDDEEDLDLRDEIIVAGAGRRKDKGKGMGSEKRGGSEDEDEDTTPPPTPRLNQTPTFTPFPVNQSQSDIIPSVPRPRFTSSFAGRPSWTPATLSAVLSSASPVDIPKREPPPRPPRSPSPPGRVYVPTPVYGPRRARFSPIEVNPRGLGDLSDSDRQIFRNRLEEIWRRIESMGWGGSEERGRSREVRRGKEVDTGAEISRGRARARRAPHEGSASPLPSLSEIDFSRPEWAFSNEGGKARIKKLLESKDDGSDVTVGEDDINDEEVEMMRRRIRRLLGDNDDEDEKGGDKNDPKGKGKGKMKKSHH